MLDSDNLAELEVGSKLVRQSDGIGDASWSVVTVERLTPTQIVLTGGYRLRRKDGRAVGYSGYYRVPVYYPATPHYLAKATRAWNLARLQRMKWGELNDKQLMEVCAKADRCQRANARKRKDEAQSGWRA